jgi:hypothetical protein
LDRCDFSSIMTCLKNHISESNQMSQPEFLYEVFEDFMNSPESKDFSFDNGLVCRWMTGQAKISPKISTYYAKPSKQEKLACSNNTSEPSAADGRLPSSHFRMFTPCLCRIPPISEAKKNRTGIYCTNLRIPGSCFWQS